MVESNDCWSYNRNTARDTAQKTGKGVVNHEKHQHYAGKAAGKRRAAYKQAGCPDGPPEGTELVAVYGKPKGRRRIYK